MVGCTSALQSPSGLAQSKDLTGYDRPGETLPGPLFTELRLLPVPTSLESQLDLEPK
jgi:hypothetical protein